MATLDLNTIVDNTSTLPTNSEGATKESGSLEVPEEVLELPIMRALLEGAPPALWAPVGTKSAEISTVLKHGAALNKIGIGFYRSDKSKLDLAFNTRFIDPELIKKADEKGALKEVASPLSEVSAQLNGAVAGPAGVATPSAGGMPSSVPVDSPLNTARVNNLEVGSPTSGNFPGRGRVINEITKNTV